MLQSTLDSYMTNEGIARYRKSVEDARQREEESKTQYGQRLLAASITPLADAIAAWLKTVGAKRSSHRGHSHAPLAKLDPTISAYITTRVVLDGIGLSKQYGAACEDVGACIEDEIRFAWLKKNQPGLFKKLDRQLSRCMSYDHKRTVIIHTMNKTGLSETPEAQAALTGWDKALRVKVGSVLIDLLEESTKLVQCVTVRSGKRQQTLLQATEATTEWIRGYSAYAELLDPVWLPMVEVPARWENPLIGGYTGQELPGLALVKRVTGDYLKNHVEKASMPDVYATINALQETPWKINRAVQGIVQHFWDMGRSVGDLPSSEDEELPRQPEDIATNKAALKGWKQRAARVHRSNAALRSTRLQARKLLNLAQKFANTEKFYFPYQLDFRGRVYTVPSFLTPQGTDLARGLLQFADGAVLNDDLDAYWLGVYGANLFGKDKVSFEDRLAWVNSQRGLILAVAADPLACQWWQEADSPWQFLAWCFEWAGWLTQGAGFVTHLPVCLDGTNNGLQILSMLTRDELAAKATNVLPSSSPADIYGDVAKRVVEFLKEEASTNELARYWLTFVIDRKTTKRPVMVLPYGGTFHSCRDYVAQWYTEAAKARGEELPEFVVVAKRCHYLATLIWRGIEFCVGRPREAMTWLQQCAAVMTEAGLPCLWTSPSGFPVLQSYKDTRKWQIETALGDKVRRIQLQEDIPNRLSRSRQKNGIAPNFVHSCDAAALTKTVSLCLQTGITSFAMIHDSYGTHAPRVHEMASALRTAFVTIFTDDWLNKLRDQLQAQLVAAGSDAVLPSVPAFGGLDVSQLHNSEFFFA